MTGQQNYCQHCVDWYLYRAWQARGPVHRERLQRHWLRYLDLSHGRG